MQGLAQPCAADCGAIAWTSKLTTPKAFTTNCFRPTASPWPRGELLVKRLAVTADGELQRRQKAADLALLNMGITFNVYGHEAGTEKIWPFDIVPRIIDGQEWDHIERGLKQRIHALNLFIDDVYHEQQDRQRRRRPRVADRVGQELPASSARA